MCNVCPPGNYTDAPAQPICKFCGAGKYTINLNGKGATSCSECAKGTWKPASAMDNKCRSCPAGYETKVDGTGASACTPCNPGYFGRLPNTALCAQCTPGTFAASSGEQWARWLGVLVEGTALAVVYICCCQLAVCWRLLSHPC